MKKLYLFLVIILINNPNSFSQETITQTLRGTVVDKASNTPLLGATIVLLNTSPPIGSVTNAEGEFRFDNVPIGRRGIQISFMGYRTITLNNLLLNSAKELVLNIELEEKAVKVDEVVITAYSKKDRPLNKMATVSARSFTIEETEKYAGSRGDVARMAMNYAGVAVANDQRNDIVIRGNSPSGLLWRLDDVDIPNPSHFADEGTTGGPVGMLNNNTLRNSDFFTGAFPADYGNALSGVFDLKMRSGNNENHEFLFQSGFNGFELGAEGPFSKNYKGSYLINFRYSTLELFHYMGINFGTGGGVPKYKDLSYKFDMPVKKGKISFFGLAGSSEIAILAKDQNEEDMYSYQFTDLYNRSKMGVMALSYTQFFSDKTYGKLCLSTLYQDGGTLIDTLDDNKDPHLYLDHNMADYRVSVNYFINTKINSRLSSKTGIKADKIGYNFDGIVYDDDIDDFRQYLKDKKSIFEGVTLSHIYTQWKYNISNNLSIHPGLHFMHFDLSNDYSIEPRIGATYTINPKHKINLGYGQHSRILPMKVYFFRSRLDDGSFVETNNDIGMTKAHHGVIGHDWKIADNVRLKTEVYYQYLFDVPIEPVASPYTVLNSGDTWGVDAVDSLVNKGTGHNYGVEITFEKFLSKGYYYLTTLSLFESNYQTLDGTSYNSTFNGRYVWNGLFGKEFLIRNKNILSFDLKVTYAGGKYHTPVDVDESRIEQETVTMGDEYAYSEQYPAFFKADVKIGYRRNKERFSEEWQFFIENVTNHKNILYQDFSTRRNDVVNHYQLGIFPMVLYRIYF